MILSLNHFTKNHHFYFIQVVTKASVFLAMESIRHGRPVLYLKGSAIDQTVGQDGFGMYSYNIEMWNDKILELASEAYYNEFYY